MAPSILTCDFTRLGEEMAFVSSIGADMVHIDVMDGVFVPNLTFGPSILRQIRPLCPLPFDVHLMMEYPDRLLSAFVEAGADGVTIHVECASPLEQTLREIRRLGASPALSVKPQTPAEATYPYLSLVDMVLVMTVEPGFGGQTMMLDMLHKVTAIRAECHRRGLSVLLQADGGIHGGTAADAAAAGVDIAVVGSALFGAADPAALAAYIHSLAVGE